MPPAHRSHRELSPLNPLDHFRLLAWVFFSPARLEEYRKRVGAVKAQKVGAWLATTLLWLPLFIPMLALGLERLPRSDHRAPLWLIGAGLVLGWALTGLFAEREHDRVGDWRASFGEVFSTGFVMVFGLAFGIAFGMALIVGFELVGITDFGTTLGPRGVTGLILAFGIAFAMGFVITDRVAFAGIFVVAPVVAFLIGFVGVFGPGFVGAFFAVFIVMFGLTFMAAFVLTLIITAIIVNRLGDDPGRGLGAVLRIAGLAIFATAHGVLIWICLLGGWAVLGRLPDAL